MTRRRTVFLSCTILAVLGATRALDGHDFWLVPEFFTAPAGFSLHIYANTGERFPESMAALARERVASARITGAEDSYAITRMHRAGNSLVLEVSPPAQGQWYVGMEVKKRPIELSAEDFNEYLAHDGLPQILELRRERDELDEPARELYSRGAKALVQVGSGGPKVWDRVLGHSIELVPLSDPSDLAPGDTLRVKLLHEQRPVRNAVVAAGYAGQPGESHVTSDRTNDRGVASLQIAEAGRWYVRTIKMIERTDTAEYDWESFWATLTFEVSEQ